MSNANAFASNNASITLCSAALVGIAGDLLIGDAARGFAFFLWIVLITAMSALLLRRNHRVIT